MRGGVNVIHGECTIIAALRDYFIDRKIEIPEFKALTQQDKVELREMLIAEGYEVLPLMGTPPQTP
jgi:hypothetical protein